MTFLNKRKKQLQKGANKLKQSKKNAPKATTAKAQTKTINFLGNYFLPYKLLCLDISFHELLIMTKDPFH
jgi:hypothetical protein